MVVEIMIMFVAGGKMELRIDKLSSTPLFRQIERQVIVAVVENNLMPGGLLPSIRMMASGLRVSVITVERAYSELEHDGYIITSRGRGSYITAPSESLARDACLGVVRDMLVEVVGLA